MQTITVPTSTVDDAASWMLDHLRHGRDFDLDGWQAQAESEGLGYSWQVCAAATKRVDYAIAKLNGLVPQA